MVCRWCLKYAGFIRVLTAYLVIAGDSSEAVLVSAQLEGLLSALHHASDCFPDLGNVDGALTLDLATRLLSADAVIAMDDQLCITVDDEVGVVTRKDKLPMPFRVPDLRDNVNDYLTIEIIFWLINDQWRPWLSQENPEQSRSLLPSRCGGEVYVLVLLGLILELRVVSYPGQRKRQPPICGQSRSDPLEISRHQSKSSQHRELLRGHGGILFEKG